MANRLSLHHYLYTDEKSEGQKPIYLRITYNRKKAEMHSGYTCKLKEWNPDGENTKTNTTINRELAKQKVKAYETLAELERNNKPITAAIIKDIITGRGSVQTYLISYLKAYIQELELRGRIKPVSLNKYKQSEKTLKEFVKSKYDLEDIPMGKVTYEFINSYDLFLKRQYDLHKNTINKYHSRLRTVLLRALAEGIILKQPYANFKLITEKTNREFLSQEDLDKIINLDISHNRSLDKVKDIFLFSCFTGLRFQDAQNLSMANLSTYKNKHTLRYAQEKTGRPVDIPLLPVAKKIIDKYKNEPERKILNKLLPKITNQKVNSYLKIIGDMAGVVTTLTHHVARHTFATTVCLNNGMPLEDVSKLLGHSSIKTTQIYGRITQDRLHKSMERIKKKI